MANTCCVCLDEVTNPFYPKCGTCRVMLHSKCLADLEMNGYSCPICKKSPPKIIFRQHPFERYLVSLPISWAERSGTILSLLIIVIYFIILSLLVLVFITGKALYTSQNGHIIVFGLFLLYSILVK